MTSVTGPAALAAGLAGAAAFLGTPASALVSAAATRHHGSPWRWLPPVAAIALVAALAGTPTALAAGACTATALGLRRRSAAHRRELRALAGLVADLRAFAGELAAGLPTDRALSLVGLDPDRASGGPRLAGHLAVLRALLDASDATGALLVAPVRRLADAADHELVLAREVDAALSAPRASARLVALLPAGGLAFGALLGAHPVQVLTQTTLGGGCVVVGVALELGSVWWLELLARRVLQPRRGATP